MRLVQRLAHPRECGRASFSVAATAAGPRRVVVTGVGLVTPLGIGTSHVWQRLVAGDSGLRVRGNYLLGANCVVQMDGSARGCGKRRVGSGGRDSNRLDLHGELPALPRGPRTPPFRHHVQALDGDLFHDLPAKVAGVVPRGSGAHEFESEQWTTRENRRLESVDFVAFALCAAQQAVEASGVLAHASFDARRAGVSFGCGIGSLEDIADAAGLVRSSQARKVSPFFVPRILTNMPAGHVSMRFGLQVRPGCRRRRRRHGRRTSPDGVRFAPRSPQGPNHAVSTACAAGAHAIGDAFRFIKYGGMTRAVSAWSRGELDSRPHEEEQVRTSNVRVEIADADVMVAGGTESCVNPIAIVGFSRLKALSTKVSVGSVSGAASPSPSPAIRTERRVRPLALRCACAVQRSSDRG